MHTGIVGTDTDGYIFGTKMIANYILFENDNIREAFDDDTRVEDVGLGINQINTSQSDGAVDYSRAGVTRIT